MALLPPEQRFSRAVIADRFALEGTRAETALFVIQQARDRLYERNVTLEVLRPGLAEDARLVAAFVEGAKAAAAIEHAGVVRVHGVEYDVDGAPFVVRERVRGQTLNEQPTPMALDAAWRILDPMLEALGVAHSLGLVHGDLRPAHVVLHANNRGALRPKIAGFGVAPLLRAVLGDVGPISPRYAAPELFGGSPPSVAGDVWAFGVIAAELLSGHHPIELGGATLPADVARAVVTSGPRSLARLAPSAPPDVVRAIDRALSVVPGARWPTASALQSALVDGTKVLQAVPRGDPSLPRIDARPELVRAPEPPPPEPRREPTGRSRDEPEPRREPTGRSRDDRDDDRRREPTGRARDDRDGDVRDRREETGSRRSRDEEPRRDDTPPRRSRDDREDRDDRRRDDTRSRREREDARRTSDERERDDDRGRRSRRRVEEDTGALPRVPRGTSPLVPIGIVVALAIGGAGIYFATRPPEVVVAPHGSVVVTNLPSGAAPHVDGAPVAATGGPIELPVGHHRLEVDGFEPMELDVSDGTTLRVTLAAVVVTPPTPPTPPAPTIRSRCFGEWRGGLDCGGGECGVRLSMTITPPAGAGCGRVEWSHIELGSGHADLEGCELGEHTATFDEPSSGSVRRFSMRCTAERTTVTAFDAAEGASLTGSMHREGEAPPEAELETPAADLHPCHGSWSGFSSATGTSVRFDLDALDEARCGRVMDPDEGTLSLSSCVLDGSMLEARSELGAVTIDCAADESSATLRSSTWGTVTLSPR